MDSAVVAAVRGHVAGLAGERTAVSTGTLEADLVALYDDVDSVAVAEVEPAALKASVADR